ncbi:hypothetical protein P6U16_23170 (plasmid) [Rhizobium sp. 32-5/1]|uniref:hypothetical protein n=1 Tax=Rhizobium sp. 32-5/1 TaxID=3019602 RepID=UPI00240D8289|nr:hypothetical protein [Rhizobium sp. 32-5/1]WEZ85893.1 hypothetical protein P6U16_23170 [Rhizobium sp. 32-5/1]
MDTLRYYTSAQVASDLITYSFCTLVTDFTRYESMVKSFRHLGFDAGDCEFLYIDNTVRNQADAFSGYNSFLRKVRGRYVVLCHQDVTGLDDGREGLDRLLSQLSGQDRFWALCGNAGVDGSGRRCIRISDPYSPDQSIGGPFPRRVVSLDENFIVVRNEANLALSRDLSGYHWYGADLCIIADILGWTAYVIDFHVWHDSKGHMDDKYMLLRRGLREKYRRAFRSRVHRVVSERNIYLSGQRIVPAIINGALDLSIWLYAHFKRLVLSKMKHR